MKKIILMSLLAAVSAVAVQAQNVYFDAVTNLNPTGYWPMHEMTPPVAGDIETNYGSLGVLGTGYYNDWNVNGGDPGSNVVLHGVAGALTNDSNTAVDFAPSLSGYSYVIIPNTTPATRLTPPFTMECWINGYDTTYGDFFGAGGAALNGGGGGGASDSVRMFWNGGLQEVQIYEGIYNTSFYSSPNYAPGVWHYVVLTCDTNDTFTLYMDGNQDKQMTDTSYAPDTPCPLMIGAGFWKSGGPTRQFHGAVDEVALYTNVFTAGDVATHYSLGTNGAAGAYFAAVTNMNPVLYYRMDSPAYVAPTMSSWPVMTNYGSVALNGVYTPGTLVGDVGGPVNSTGAFIPGLGSDTNAMPGNGLSSYGDAGYDTAFDPTNNTPLSVMAWFRGNPADARLQTIVGHSDSSWHINLDAYGKLHFNPGVGSDAVSANVYNDGNWHQVVGVYDGSTNYLYVDGLLESEVGATGTIAGSTNDVLLGADPQYTDASVATGAGQQFAGDVCEVAFWNGTALTASQIQGVYSAAGIPLQIVQQPAATATKQGNQTNTFSIIVQGSSPVYQWYYNTVSNYAGASALSDGPTGSGSVVSGATAATLTITNLRDGDNGYYYVVATNDFNSVTSSISELTVFTAPSITAQVPSSNFTLYEGQDYTLSVTANGAAPLVYQWLTNGVADTTAGTSSTYALSGVTLGMSGMTFQCVVTNDLGAVTNTEVTMSVSPLPTDNYSSNVLSLNPTAYWPMHEMTPPVHGDIETNYGSLGVLGTGYYNDWDVNGGDPGSNVVIHGVPGVLTNDSDTAVSFNTGNWSYMLVPHTSPATTLTPPFTMECWFNGASVHAGQPYGDILGEGGATLNSGGGGSPWDGVRIFWAGQVPAIQIYVGHGTGNSSWTSVTNYALDTWHYLVLTCDTNDTFSLYVDGNYDSQRTYANYVPTTCNPLLVGAGFWKNNGPQRQFHGAVDEVAIYTNVFSASDVAAHYNLGTNGAAGAYFAAVTNMDPVLYYRMDSPAYVAPAMSSWPVLTNYGTVALNGHYTPGTMPGVVGGLTDAAGNFVGGLMDTNAMPGNGLSAYADAGYNAAFNPTGNTPLTVAAWFKGNPADPRLQTIVGHSDNSWRISLDGYGKLHFNAGAGGEITSANVYNDGNWHQVVGVYNGGTNFLYVDGVLDTENTSVTGTIPGSTDDVLLGADPQYLDANTGVGQQFAGNICEVAFWNGTALNAAQVQALYGAIGILPRIVQQPHSSIASQGSHYTNTVVAVGTTPLSYQWYQNDSLVLGQTNATLDYNPLASGEGGNYYVIVTNNYGAVTSSVVTLTVIQAPVITKDITSATKTNNITLYAGAHPTFQVAAVGAIPLSYQWFTNNVKVAGATSASYMLPPVQMNGVTNFAVVVTNTQGAATSTVVSVTVVSDPTAPYPQAVLADSPLGYWPLNEGPDNNNGNDGAIADDYWNANNGIYTNVQFGAPTYSGNTDPSASSTWFGTFDYSNCMAYGIQTVDFATSSGSSNFTVEAWANPYTTTTDAGIVSKGYGNGGEQFCLELHNNLFRFFVRDASGTVHVANSSIGPDFNWHYVVGVCDEVDGSVKLYVDGVLAGSAAITPGSGILASTNAMLIGSRPGGTDTSYNNSQFVGALSGVAVYNYALSASQVLSHYYATGIAPQITQDVPSSTNVNENGSISLAVGAMGTPPLSYQWYSQTTGQLSGQTNATLSLSSVTSGDTYYVTINNAYGSTNSSTETINVISGAPQIGSPALPPNVFVYSNSVYPYSVTAAGTEPFSYQWYNNGVPISGANQSTYSLLALTNTTITVSVANGYGAVTSNPSMLMIVPHQTNTYAQAIEALGPVGYWPMQETNAPAPSNIETNLGSLGPQANAYYLDSPANPVVGHGAASALNSDSDPSTSFNGQNNCYMAAPAINTNMALNAPFSIELWANPADTSFGMAVAKNGFVGLNSGLPGSGAGNLCGWSVDWSRSNSKWDLQLYHNVAGQNNAIQIFGPAGAGAVGQWQHVVFTYDGTTVKFYWNGQLEATGSATYVPDTWSPLCVGGGRLAQGTPGNQGVRLYNGLEDEVALYTNVLSAADILAHYQAGTNSSPATPYKQLVLNDHPLVYYRMDAPSYSTPSALDNPALINYGSVPVTGDYPPNTVPGGVAGPDLAGLGGSNVVASPINGLNAAVDAGYVSEFNRTNGQPLTAMIWVKGYPTDGRVQSPMSHGDNSWHFSWDSAGKVHWSSGNSSGEVISSQVVNDGQWHMLAGVYDGSQNLLYVDGALDGTAPAGSVSGSTSDVYLGGAPDYVDTTNEAYFSGSICQAAFFTNALTATQIQNVYNAANTVIVPTLSIAPANGQMVLTWNVGTLLSATNVTGPYNPVAGAASPYTNAPSAAQMFYRVSNP